MPIPQISANSVLATPADLNPPAQTVQNSTVVKADEAVQKAEVESKTDSVTISKQALRKASELFNLAEKAQDSPLNRAEGNLQDEGK